MECTGGKGGRAEVVRKGGRESRRAKVVSKKDTTRRKIMCTREGEVEG